MEPAASGKKPLSPAKKKWIILAAVAAALVLFALWYTRPRSWAEVAGQRAFTSLNAQYQEISAEAGGTAFHVWELEIREPGEEAMEALMSALRAGRYRATLGNLWRSGERFSGNSQEIVYLSGAMEETEAFFCGLTARGEMFVADDGGFLLYTADDGRCDAVASLIREYGVLRNETAE